MKITFSSSSLNYLHFLLALKCLNIKLIEYFLYFKLRFLKSNVATSKLQSFLLRHFVKDFFLLSV